jgi:hypothetical protein
MSVYRTSDALAEDVLASMLTIEAAYRPGEGLSPELLVAGGRFLEACQRLLASGPPQYRVEVARLLPLTRLELDLLDQADVGTDSDASRDLAARLGEWLTRSPLLVDEHPVHVAEFLSRLWPSLGLWEDRLAVDALIQRTTGPAGAIR